jgi:gluconolactonase
MTHTAHRARFEELIDVYAPVGQVGTGFTFTEGPIWHPREHYLLFSDMPADVRRRWDARGGVREVKRPANRCNGMTYDSELNLIVCEHSTSSLVRERPDGRREVLVSHYEGRELNSPNDVCVRSDGGIYFSDPWYGRMPVYGVERPRELGFQGVYRVRPGGQPELLVDRGLFDQPNGLCFSPDESLLYVNDTVRALIRVFAVRPNGTLGEGRIFAQGIRSELEPGVPDGMKCDEQGNVWVTGPGGIHVFAADGDLLGRVRIPEMAANLAWGGPDFRTLFVTATHSVYTVPTRVGPRREPYMRAESAVPAEKREGLTLDPSRCALLIQDLQNDVIGEGGAFAASGAPAHAKSQGVVDNVRRLAEACRARGVPVIHVWFVVEPGAPGLTLNCPLFEGVADGNALVRGTWGAAPVAGLEKQEGDFVVEKMRMSAWEGSRLETVLRALGRDVLINTGAWTNMSVEHTARTGADKGYLVVVPADCCSTMNPDWQRASLEYAMSNVAAISTADEVIAALA